MLTSKKRGRHGEALLFALEGLSLLLSAVLKAREDALPSTLRFGRPACYNERGRDAMPSARRSLICRVRFVDSLKSGSLTELELKFPVVALAQTHWRVLFLLLAISSTKSLSTARRADLSLLMVCEALVSQVLHSASSNHPVSRLNDQAGRLPAVETMASHGPIYPLVVPRITEGRWKDDGQIAPRIALFSLFSRSVDRVSVGHPANVAHELSQCCKEIDRLSNARNVLVPQASSTLTAQEPCSHRLETLP